MSDPDLFDRIVNLSSLLSVVLPESHDEAEFFRTFITRETMSKCESIRHNSIAFGAWLLSSSGDPDITRPVLQDPVLSGGLLLMPSVGYKTLTTSPGDVLLSAILGRHGLLPGYNLAQAFSDLAELIRSSPDILDEQEVYRFEEVYYRLCIAGLTDSELDRKLLIKASLLPIQALKPHLKPHQHLWSLLTVNRHALAFGRELLLAKRSGGEKIEATGHFLFDPFSLPIYEQAPRLESKLPLQTATFLRFMLQAAAVGDEMHTYQFLFALGRVPGAEDEHAYAQTIQLLKEEALSNLDLLGRYGLVTLFEGEESLEPDEVSVPFSVARFFRSFEHLLTREIGQMQEDDDSWHKTQIFVLDFALKCFSPEGVYCLVLRALRLRRQGSELTAAQRDGLKRARHALCNGGMGLDLSLLALIEQLLVRSSVSEDEQVDGCMRIVTIGIMQLAVTRNPLRRIELAQSIEIEMARWLRSAYLPDPIESALAQLSKHWYHGTAELEIYGYLKRWAEECLETLIDVYSGDDTAMGILERKLTILALRRSSALQAVANRQPGSLVLDISTKDSEVHRYQSGQSRIVVTEMHESQETIRRHIESPWHYALRTQSSLTADDLRTIDGWWRSWNAQIESRLLPDGPQLRDLKPESALVIVPEDSWCDVPYNAILKGSLLESGRCSDDWEIVVSDRARGPLGLIHDIYLTTGGLMPPQDRPVLSEPKALVIGVSDFSHYRPSAISPKFRHGEMYNHLDRLPAAVLEAEEVATLYPSCVHLQHQEQSTRRVRMEMGRADIIHIATHHVYPHESLRPSQRARDAAAGTLHLNEDDSFARNALLSYMVLGDGSADANLLLTKEVYLAELTAKVVVLTGCDTVRHSPISGAAFGAADAYLAAGAECVVASLWPANDGSSLLFAKEFHLRLLQGETVASAARHGRCAVASDPRFTSPYYWAPFTVIGNGATRLVAPR
ncbi:MAG: CHAT domain-containing protein [Methanoregulaceae archaeon]|nr:CHAT domain-containing protein [Methanoregulaceae archaeon]